MPTGWTGGEETQKRSKQHILAQQQSAQVPIFKYLAVGETKAVVAKPNDCGQVPAGEQTLTLIRPFFLMMNDDPMNKLELSACENNQSSCVKIGKRRLIRDSATGGVTARLQIKHATWCGVPVEGLSCCLGCP
jgi:hypothetical protein